MKYTFIIFLTFLSTQFFAQSNFTPFSDAYSKNIEEAKIEISNVVNRFNEVITNKNIDWKLVDCGTDNEGYTVDVYILDGKVRKISIPYFDLGNNGNREFYYQDSGELGLIIDYDHQAYHVNKYYHLLGFNKVWNFFSVEDISPQMDYLKSLDYIDTSLSENEEFVLDFSYNSFLDIKNKMNLKAKNQTFDTSSPVFLKGSIDFKYPIIMNLNFEKNHVLTGKYRYQKSKQDIVLKGTWTSEHFELYEYDTKGNNTGKFKGQFINSQTASGTWQNKKATLYFELTKTDTYSFLPKTIADNEIGQSQAGIFKIGETFPEKLPKGFTNEIEKQVIFDEGVRFTQYIAHVKKNGEHLLDCTIEENIIQEIKVFAGYKTHDDIGVGSSLESFVKTYIKHHIWYTYVSDRYIIDSELLGENIQFILNKKDYLYVVDFNEDVYDLKLSRFKKDARIQYIIIH